MSKRWISILLAPILAAFLVFVGWKNWSQPKLNSKISRGPSSDEDEDRESQYINLLKLVVKYDQTDPRTYTVLRLPIRSLQDFTPNVPSELDRALEREIGINHYTVQSSFKSDVYENVGASTDPEKAIQDYIRELFFDRLESTERIRLLDICMDGLKVGPGARAAVLFQREICEFAGLLFSKFELETAFREFPAQPSGVRYDGNRGRHVYTNADLLLKVQIIAAAINSYKISTRELFRALPENVKAKFKKNRNGTGELDKTEPFDLVAVYTTNWLIDKNQSYDFEIDGGFNHIEMSKLSQKALSRFFGMVEAEDNFVNSLPSLTVTKTEEKVRIFCASGIFDSNAVQYGRPQYRNGFVFTGDFNWMRREIGSELVESWYLTKSLKSFITSGGAKIPFTCNSNEYFIRAQSIPAETVPHPAPLQFAKGQDLYALMTLSLVDEIDREAIKKGEALLANLAGWELEEDVRSVSTREFLKQEFPRIDAYIPVMHSMDVNYFNVSTERALSIRMRKQVPDGAGGQRTVHMALLLPDKENNSYMDVTLRPDDLAVLMDERFQKKPTSLFLMNNSCGSEKTLLAWELVFRRALDLRRKRDPQLDISQVRDFPYVIGSKRSFGTSTLLEIFSHVDYPLRAIEMLASNKSIPEILEFLKQPSSNKFLEGLGSLMGNSFGNRSSEDENGFAPDYILDYPVLLSYGGLKVFLSGRGIQGENEY